MPDVSKRLEKAEKYLQKGKMDHALQEYLQALQEDPGNDAVCQAAADICVSLNRNDEAAELLNDLFDRQAGINDVAKANITYKKLTKVTTPALERTLRYAQLIEKKDKRESLEAFRTAAAGLDAAGRKAEALTAYQRLVALDPTVEHFGRLGELSAERGDAAEAAIAFGKAGDLEREGGGDGLEWYRRALAHDGNNLHAAVSCARALLARGDAGSAAAILEPLVGGEQSTPELRETYARALLAGNRPLDAEPFAWELFERNAGQIEQITQVIGALLQGHEHERALALARKLDQHETRAGRRREFVALIKEVTDKNPPGLEFLEYLVELYNSANREHDYCRALLRLFDLYYAASNFLKAGDALDRAAEVDPYEPGHQKRVEMLRGKLDQNRFNALAARFTVVDSAENKPASGQAPAGDEPTLLEDFMLQAEIFLRYSMRSRALERLQRINKLFPGEEVKNEKLHKLYADAGFVPQYEPGSAPAAPAAAPVAPAPASAPARAAAAAADESAVDNFAKVTEITRNIYRQATVKGVLFAAVNDIGRHWNASRCVAALVSPGKPPTAALEYCAPGVKQGDVMDIVKLVMTVQGLALTKGVVAVAGARSAPELASIREHIANLGTETLLAIPLLDGEEPSGILILQQAEPRHWSSTDSVVLKTIADQMVLAANNARLRTLMKTLAVTDEKSGLLKRSSYLDVLLSEVRRSMQQNMPLTIMLAHFGKPSALVKEIGEPAVESMMQEVGQVVSSHVRQNDVAVRYDLTTIAVVLADTADKNAFFVVDKFRRLLASTVIPSTNRPVVLTAGIAEAYMQARFDPVDIVTELINRAEAALEIAKTEGGNRAHSLAAETESAAVA
jgi:diguanylate cyclase (GGDEF)-like protein